ncbi:TIR domain-containing protein [Pseudarthrobacter oxydans]|uniref:TIR domain-containing protein n=1 Tax=Pseudarthrobacter oxydans TaxID=1671 RepID=UPI0037FFC4C5
MKERERLFNVFAGYAGKNFWPPDWDGFITQTRLYSVQGDTAFTNARDAPLEDGAARSVPLSYRFIANHFDKLGSTDREKLEMLEVGTPKLMEWALFEVEGRDRQDFCRFLEANWDVIPENWQEGAKQSDEAHRFPSDTKDPVERAAVPSSRTATTSRLPEPPKGKPTLMAQVNEKTNPIFIIHGHADAKKKEMYNFLHDITGIRPLILHEQGSASDTIIEKLERVAEEPGYAVALLTADDLGRSVKEAPGSEKPRGRQNVVFEAGYFMALLGRKNVALLKDDGVEDIGDLSGVVYMSFSDDWKSKLAKELEKAEYKIVWHRVNP